MLMMVRRCQGGASRVSRSGEDHTQGEGVRGGGGRRGVGGGGRRTGGGGGGGGGEADGQRAHALTVAVSQYPVCARAGFYLLTYLHPGLAPMVQLAPGAPPACPRVVCRAWARRMGICMHPDCQFRRRREIYSGHCRQRRARALSTPPFSGNTSTKIGGACRRSAEHPNRAGVPAAAASRSRSATRVSV